MHHKIRKQDNLECSHWIIVINKSIYSSHSRQSVFFVINQIRRELS
jgi:hypothetical protein